jgi:hypothetical protein
MQQEMMIVFVLWLALQIPLGSFIGGCILFGATEKRFA